MANDTWKRDAGGWVRAFPLMAPFVLALAACGSPSEPVDCAVVDPNPYAILVTVVNAVTGDTIRTEMSGETTGGGQVRAMIELASGELAAQVPQGVYDVETTAGGFGTWDTTGIVSVPGVCGGFVSVELLAPVQPQ